MMGILSESHRESELNLLQQLKISQSAFGIKMSAAILSLLPTCSHCFYLCQQPIHYKHGLQNTIYE